jgi:hypothetical protein
LTWSRARKGEDKKKRRRTQAFFSRLGTEVHLTRVVDGSDAKFEFVGELATFSSSQSEGKGSENGKANEKSVVYSWTYPTQLVEIHRLRIAPIDINEVWSMIAHLVRMHRELVPD